jgi:small subunit ribosomal protein S16
MVKIRLTRTGKKHEAHYRIIASDSRSPRDGKFIEILGYYNPRTKPSTVQVKTELIEKWLKNGAQMSETVRGILTREGIIKDKVKKVTKKRVSKGKKALAKKAAKAAPKAKPAAKKSPAKAEKKATKKKSK